VSVLGVTVAANGIDDDRRRRRRAPRPSSTSAASTLAPLGEDFGFDAGIGVDGLTAMMFLLVTFVSLMVHIYSTGYMHGEERFTWYYALLSLFTASMLLLVIADNLMLLLVGWELVGVCSFLLIGFWWEEKKNSTRRSRRSSPRSSATSASSSASSPCGRVRHLQHRRDHRLSVVQAGGEPLSTGLLTFGLIALFIGAIGKSAQFPLHTWLPDAMAGPTPVSALIHAATMVTAGVFLVARLYPVYSRCPGRADDVIAVIGAITLFMRGLLAIVQDDVKKVLAYSTVSQLGYMVAALAFSYTAGIFHLFTHGFFKALLFLGSGSLIHAAHSNNMSDMGGLRKKMPVTFWTFLIGSLALMAVPPLAGFWSKDEILAGGATTRRLHRRLGRVGPRALGGLRHRLLHDPRALPDVLRREYRGHGHPHESPLDDRAARRAGGPVGAHRAHQPAVRGFFQPVRFSAWTMFSLEYWETHPVEFIWGDRRSSATGLALVGFLVGARSTPGPRSGTRLQQPGRWSRRCSRTSTTWTTSTGTSSSPASATGSRRRCTGSTTGSSTGSCTSAGTGTAASGRKLYRRRRPEGHRRGHQRPRLSANWTGGEDAARAVRQRAALRRCHVRRRRRLRCPVRGGVA
jgi:NADH-quinone oxidoreductase subunit L